jgi:hypothetical protein
MSFYDISSNPLDFNVRDPNEVLQNNLRFIKSGFDQRNEVIPTSTTLLGSDILAGYIIVEPSIPTSYTTDTAENLLESILNAITARCSNFFGLKPGFNFDFCIYNEGVDDAVLFGGTNVILGAAPSFTITPSKMQWFRLTVTHTTEGSEEIYINLLTYTP